MQPPPVSPDGPTGRRAVAARRFVTDTVVRKRGPTVLLIDDDSSVRESIGRVLVAAALQVVAARGVKDALDHLGRNTPDLIITDLCMVPLSGLDLIIFLENHHPTLPVFIVTALPMPLVGEARRKASAVFQKPLDFDVLLAAIRRQLSVPVS